MTLPDPAAAADDAEDDAPGWRAIDTALDRLYPGVEPLHYGTLLKWSLGGPDPLDGVSLYRRPDHWHVVSYGMSELYRKESPDRGESGWGFEFTFRPARAAADDRAPMWAANLLQNLARYVFSSGNAFAAGHHVDLNGPIALSHPDTEIRAITFAEDPELGTVDTPHGRVRFLQVVGLTLDEYAAIERWDATGLLEVLSQRVPLLVTDPARRSLTTDPQVAAAIEAGSRRDGSSTGSLFVAEAGWKAEDPRWRRGGLTINVGANAAERIGRVLAARLPFGRGLLVQAEEGGIGFIPGDRFDVAGMDGNRVEVSMPPPVLDELVRLLRPVAGTYRLDSTPGLTLRIEKSLITDQDGRVVAEIG